MSMRIYNPPIIEDGRRDQAEPDHRTRAVCPIRQGEELRGEQATGGPGVDTTNFAIDEDGSFLADEDGTIFELEAL
jgi:hypothetical protein